MEKEKEITNFFVSANIIKIEIQKMKEEGKRLGLSSNEEAI